MPSVMLKEQTFSDPLTPELYGDVVVPTADQMGSAVDSIQSTFYDDVVKDEKSTGNTSTGDKVAFGGFDISSEYVRDHADSFGMASTVSSSDDVRFWAGATYANRASAPFRVTEAGVVTGTTGNFGGFSIGSDYIRDAANSFGLASTVTGGDDVRFWAGATFANRATAPFRVTEAGVVTLGNSTDFLSYDGSILQTAGKSVTQDRFTTGHAVDQGDILSSEAGLVYRTRVNNFSANGTATTAALGAAPVAAILRRPGAFLSISSTVKLMLFASDNATDEIAAIRVVGSPSSSSITSATRTASINTAPAQEDVDGCALTATTAVAGYVTFAGGIGLKVLSDLDTGLTQNTEYAADNTNHRIAILPVSATEFFVIYTDTASDNIIMKPYTVSGVTISATAGGAQTILADANVLQVRSAKRFGDTTAYCVYFYDSTNTISYVIAFTYAGADAAVSVGSKVQVAAANTVGSLAPSDDTHMVIGYSSTTSVIGNGISRSGTTLTVGGSPTTIDTVEAGASGTFVDVLRMGKGNHIFSWMSNAGATEVHEWQATDLNGTTIAALGSSGTVTTSGGDEIAPVQVKLAPSRSIVFRDTTATPEFGVAVIDWSNNFNEKFGIATAAANSGASILAIQGGTSDDVTGLTVSTAYYVDAGGGLTTSALGGTVRFGQTVDSTTEIDVD